MPAANGRDHDVMTDLIDSVVRLAEAHAGLVYVLAFVATFFESLAVVGLVVPGSGVIVALGALIPSGTVKFLWLCFWSILGALGGDGVSYLFGWRYRDRLAQWWPFSRYPEVLVRGERFFAVHGGKSVFLSRFVAPVRGSVPLVAGMAGMRPGRFFIVSVLSALGWAPAHILPGALIGAGLTLTGVVAARLLVLVVVVAAVLWIAGKITAIAVRHSIAAIAAAQQRIDGWARRHEGWLARQTLALLYPGRGEARAFVLLGLILVAAAWVFFGVLEDVVTGDPLVRADTAIYNMLQGLRSLAGDQVMIAITELGDAVVAGAVAAVVLLWLSWRRAWYAAACWAAAVAGAGVIGIVIKLALHRPRPISIYAGWDAFSFPSGHATTNAAIYGFLAVLLARHARPALQVWIGGAAAFTVALIGFSRIYLGAHWFSDVVGGIAFGTAWIALLAIFYVRHSTQRVAAVPLAAIALTTIIAVGGFQIAHKMPSDIQRYMIRDAERTMTAATWWKDGWRALPSRRVDLVGEREEPLILQWAGNLDDLKTRLVAGGWRRPAPWSVAAALGWLGASGDPLRLPVLARLHDGRPAALTLIHVELASGAPNDRWVLRVWRAGTRLVSPSDQSRPLWVGAITRQRFQGTLAPFGLGFESHRIIVPYALLERALPASRLTTRADGKAGIQVLLARDPTFRIALPHLIPSGVNLTMQPSLPGG